MQATSMISSKGQGLWQRFRGALLALGLAAALPLGGCVSQGDWDNLYATNRSLKDALTRAEQERDQYRNSLDLIREQLAREQQASTDLRNQVNSLRGMLEQAGVNLAGLQSQLDNANFTALDPETDSLLRELADKYPDLIIYDADSGRLRFASDLTFDSGSDVVKDSARASLRALAQILTTSSAASAYDIHVVGHTDSQRISAGTTGRRHPTNMHLSCHRAISVRGELASMGVSPGKMEAAGWGEFRPLVANTSSGNTPQNRRVEIYLTRPKGGSGAMGSAPSPSFEPSSNNSQPERTRTPDRQPDITK
jgi:chemotaxis protein MotB